MSNFYIRDIEQAQAIIKAYERCSNCADCPLNTPEGWACGYLYNVAVDYINHNK